MTPLLPPDPSQFISGYSIPGSVTGLKTKDSKKFRAIRIGSCVYGRYPGVFVYIVWSELEAYGLQEDGTWQKYGHNFGTLNEAYDALREHFDKIPWLNR